jgi:coiled-coil domain-containing protein 130
MGRYVPPDQEGVMSGNQIHGKHALGARANKISQGILTVRFEMPFPIWCTHCPKPTIIGQGVRFNAEKKKVGNYFSSPIYSFRMKHTACGGWIEIQTDPKTTTYLVIAGARKRDHGGLKEEEGYIKILTNEEKEELRNNAFAALEGKVEDKQKLEHSKKRLEELQDLSEQMWDDPYEQNKRLRRSFRQGRKQREQEAGVTAALQDKMSLGLDLLPENEDDARRAALIEYGEDDDGRRMDKIISKPLFKTEEQVSKSKLGSKASKSSRKLKAEKVAEQKREVIAAEIRGNTRAAMDPFLADSRASRGTTKPFIAGLKRKQSQLEESPAVATLVDYDSD